MLGSFKSIYRKISKILIHHEAARDNDRLLIIKAWCEHNPKLRDPDYPFMQFAIKFIEGEYDEPESITRCRRKLQQEYPQLRGSKYYKKKAAAAKVKNEVSELRLTAG